MISSRYNPQYKELKSLLEPRGAKKAGKVLVAGRKIVPEFVNDSLLMLAEEEVWPNDLAPHENVLWLERQLFKDLDIFGTHYPIAVCELPPMPVWTVSPPQGLELVLSLQDPANLGAVLRSAEAFGVSKVILLKECAFPFHPKAIRASSGSSFRITYAEGPPQKEFSDEHAFALDKSGEPIANFAWPKDCRLFLGEEGQGVRDFSGRKLSIPMKATMDSLNATIAASIACFSFHSKHPL